MSWIVVETRSLQEAIAVKDLTSKIRLGVCDAVHCPTYSREIRHARYVRQRELPLYPRYIFANVDLRARHWTQILYSRGVRGVLGSRPSRRGDICEPSPVADAVIAAIGYFGVRDELTRGERVLLKEWGVEALFSEYVEDRCRVLLSFMGKEVSWDVSRLQVERVAA